MKAYQPISINGHYDESGHWQRTKFCFVYCGERCNCGPPGGLHYSEAHDENKTAKPDKSKPEPKV